jgi:hypothetical protein
MIEHMGGDQEIVISILPDLVQGLQDETAALQVALGTGKSDEAARIAHTAKGLAGTACCPNLVLLAIEMEQAARQGELEQIEALLPDWVLALDTLGKDVNQWLGA